MSILVHILADKRKGELNSLLLTYFGKYFGGENKRRILFIASHLRVLDEEFEDLFSAAKLLQFPSWEKNLYLHVQNHIEGIVTCIPLDYAMHRAH